VRFHVTGQFGVGHGTPFNAHVGLGNADEKKGTAAIAMERRKKYILVVGVFISNVFGPIQ